MDFNFTHTIRNVECSMTMIGYTVSVSKFRPFQKSDSVMTSVNSISFRSFKFQWILVFKKHFHSLFGLYVLQNNIRCRCAISIWFLILDWHWIRFRSDHLGLQIDSFCAHMISDFWLQNSGATNSAYNKNNQFTQTEH